MAIIKITNYYKKEFFFIGNVSKELLREYINEQKFNPANDILAGLKEMFKDVFQESLEAEMDEALGYGKYDNIDEISDNILNGYSKCAYILY